MSESNNPTRGPSRRLDHAITYDCDWTETDPCMAVVEAISVAANRTPLDERPLYETVDTDALNDLFRADDGRPSPELEARFTYGRFEVTVSGVGRVTVRLADGGDFPR